MRRPQEETRQARGIPGGAPLVERRVVDPTPAPSVIARGKRIVVVGVNFHPEPTGIGPYTTGLTDHLAASGANVTIITGIHIILRGGLRKGTGSVCAAGLCATKSK